MELLNILRKILCPCPHDTRLGIWYREKGSVAPSHVSPINFHALAASGAYSRVLPLSAMTHLYHEPPLGQSRVHQVIKLRTDGVYH